MYDSIPGAYIVQSLRRDFQGPQIDGLHLIFDTFADLNNAFNFSINPYGVQREGLISNGGAFGSTDVSWDNRWFSKVSRSEGYWMAELAIPFKTIRYKENTSSWNANFFRLDNKQNERSVWSRIPRGFRLSTLAFAGRIIFDDPLPKAGANIAFIPFITAGATKDYEENTATDINRGIGGDIKVGITPSLNLDITVNPDFSQVEVDRQQTNLSRFELFFPERRQFFLENADLFASLGMRSSHRPFFSRRIGIGTDTSDTRIQIPIVAGLRLSGKLDNNWRIGLLNIQTAENDASRLPSLNYGVAAVQRKLFINSNITAFFANKQPMFNNTDKQYLYDLDSLNRVAGIEYNLRSANGQWNGKVYYHQSITPGINTGQGTAGGFIAYRIPKINFFISAYTIGENFNAEVGFVPRKNVHRVAAGFDYNFYPNTKTVNRHGPGLFVEYQWNNQFSVTDAVVNIDYEVRLQNSSSLSLGGRYIYTYLFDSFDPSGTSGAELPSDTDYHYGGVGWEYNSDRRKLFFVESSGFYSKYFNGTRFNVQGSINYRIQPQMVFALSYNYNRIRLPHPYNDADLLLIGPRIDFTFTRNLFLTVFIQYNNQDGISNLNESGSQFRSNKPSSMNINARLQWRFKPVSDLFFVYTDNYFSDIKNPLGIKGRAVVLKLTYWLNL